MRDFSMSMAAALLLGSAMANGAAAQYPLDGSTPAIEEDADEATQPSQPEAARPDGYRPPEVQRDLSALPFPVRRMRELLIEAAQSGNIDRLRPYIGTGDDMTLLSFGGPVDDPIETLKTLSGDQEGYEILAILQEVLETGYVHIDSGTDNEMYVWPYFYRVTLADLEPAQRVELYRLLTHGDYEDMKAFGAYIFYRVGITPKGRWRFFVAGD